MEFVTRNSDKWMKLGQVNETRNTLDFEVNFFEIMVWIIVELRTRNTCPALVSNRVTVTLLVTWNTCPILVTNRVTVTSHNYWDLYKGNLTTKFYKVILLYFSFQIKLVLVYFEFPSFSYGGWTTDCPNLHPKAIMPLVFL